MKRVLIACVVLIGLAGCSTLPRYEAANDVHAFLASIRDGDRAAFDAHVDKAALKTNLKARVLAETAHHDKLAGIATLLAGPLLDVAVDTAARPEVFRLVATEYGYDAEKPLPNTLAIAQYVRPLDGGRACIVTKAKGPCLFIFKDEDGVWKLIDFEGHIGFDKGKLRMTE